MKYFAVFFTAILIYLPISLIMVLAIYALFLSIKALKIYINKNS